MTDHYIKLTDKENDHMVASRKFSDGHGMIYYKVVLDNLVMETQMGVTGTTNFKWRLKTLSNDAPKPLLGNPLTKSQILGKK